MRATQTLTRYKAEICSDLVYGELRREIEGGGGFS
jgi:hypothetical protein